LVGKYCGRKIFTDKRFEGKFFYRFYFSWRSC
jgi:hypothetical protein